MIKSLRFYFIRHGRTKWNVEHRVHGSTEMPLNVEGHKQVLRATEVLKKSAGPISEIISSPQGRALVTATILSSAFDRAVRLSVEPDLRERKFGMYEGRKVRDLHRVPIYADRPDGPLDFPGSDVEEFFHVVKRARAVVEFHLKKSRGDAVPLFVSHSGIGRALLEAYNCEPISIENAQLYQFQQQSDSKWECRPV